LVCAKDVSLGCFYKPIAIVAPNKFIQSLRDSIELIVTIRRLNCIDRFIQARENFHREDGYLALSNCRRSFTWTVHLPKPRHIPKFCRKVAAFLDLFFIKSNVLTSGRD